MTSNSLASFTRLVLVLALLLCVLPGMPAYAADGPNVPMPTGTCSTDPTFDIPDTGMISKVASGISDAMNGLADFTFTKIASGMGGIGGSIYMMGMIYIIIYGILFMIGGVSVTVWEFTVRVVKLGVVFTLIGNPQDVFNIMNDVFEDGTNDIINTVIKTMTGEKVDTSGPPLYAADDLASKIISAKMIVTLIAAFTTGPYGPLLGGLLLLAVKELIQAILSAAWVYLMAMVVRALLYGVAPIFIPCLLFTRTRPLFDGWLNQLVNASLQPIMLFAFFSFFVAITTDMVNVMLQIPVCWSPMEGTARGTPLLVFGWRFTVQGDTGYELYSGSWGLGGVGGQMFPIPVMTILLFFVLAELSGRFNHIVLGVAGGIAGASTSFSEIRSMFTDWSSDIKGAQGGPPAGANNDTRKEPGVGASPPNTKVDAAKKNATVGVGTRK